MNNEQHSIIERNPSPIVMIIDYSIENQAFLPTITLELLLLELIFLMESNAKINLLHLPMLSLVFTYISKI